MAHRIWVKRHVSHSLRAVLGYVTYRMFGTSFSFGWSILVPFANRLSLANAAKYKPSREFILKVA